jgi:hypothetical protein
MEVQPNEVRSRFVPLKVLNDAAVVFRRQLACPRRPSNPHHTEHSGAGLQNGLRHCDRMHACQDLLWHPGC